MKRGKFSLSHYKLMSMSMGKLYPCGLTEVLPGDSIQHAVSAFVRCAPMVTPPMHPCHVRVHKFFVPMRLLWTNWEDFITGGPDGMNASVHPTLTVTGSGRTLGDFMGCMNQGNGFVVSALPFRAYGLIFNEYFRDQDLVTKRVVSLADGTDTTTDMTIARVAWEKDYFTSARPWTKKGPDVTVPVSGGSASKPVTPDTTAPTVNIAGHSNDGIDVAGTTGIMSTHTAPGANSSVTSWSNTGMKVDTSSLFIDVDDLRTAMALQRFEEMRARFGSRYTEYLRSLGVRSSDARLQRPEYLGGGRQTIQFSEVLQTGVTTSGNVAGVGNLTGHGLGVARSHRYRKYFEEHGYVMTLISCIPKTIYAQSLQRTFTRRVKTDYFQKELQHIGQQEVLSEELNMDTDFPGVAFGYQDRYDEYRRQESTVAGQFRPGDIFETWHFARNTDDTAVLNSDFVSATPSVLPFADQTGDDTLLVMVNHNMQARRIVDPSARSYIF